MYLKCVMCLVYRSQQVSQLCLAGLGLARCRKGYHACAMQRMFQVSAVMVSSCE